MNIRKLLRCQRRSDLFLEDFIIVLLFVVYAIILWCL